MTIRVVVVDIDVVGEAANGRLGIEASRSTPCAEPEPEVLPPVEKVSGRRSARNASPSRRLKPR